VASHLRPIDVPFAVSSNVETTQPWLRKQIDFAREKRNPLAKVVPASAGGQWLGSDQRRDAAADLAQLASIWCNSIAQRRELAREEQG